MVISPSRSAFLKVVTVLLLVAGAFEMGRREGRREMSTPAITTGMDLRNHPHLAVYNASNYFLRIHAEYSNSKHSSVVQFNVPSYERVEMRVR